MTILFSLKNIFYLFIVAAKLLLHALLNNENNIMRNGYYREHGAHSMA